MWNYGDRIYYIRVKQISLNNHNRKTITCPDRIMIWFQLILVALELMILCTNGSLRIRWDSLTVNRLYAFDNLKCLTHTVLAIERDNFRQLRILWENALSCQKWNFRTFLIKVQTHHLFEKEIPKLFLKTSNSKIIHLVIHFYYLMKITWKILCQIDSKTRKPWTSLWYPPIISGRSGFLSL